METALQIIIALFCIPLGLLGLRSMFKPADMGQAVAIEPRGKSGLNTIRGVLGGFFLACVAMLALGLATGDTTWFASVALLMGAVIVGRVVGVVADGFDRAVVPPLVVEVVIGSVLMAANLAIGT